MDITERKENEERIKSLNLKLEQRVLVRTAELKETNKELKHAQEEIVQKERLAALGRLAGSIAHELRNPLGVISNSMYFLNDAGPDIGQDMIKKYYDIISHESEISVKIINDLLDFGRDTSPEFTFTKISELVNNSLSGIQIPDDEGIEVVVDIEPENLSTSLDPTQMDLALRNLMDNACQAMESGGTLTIRSFKQDENIIIEISDTGSGISKDDYDKIFQPLFSTKTKGFGLGLSITKKYIEASRGNIDFTSELGKGTTFTISLPEIL